MSDTENNLIFCNSGEGLPKDKISVTWINQYSRISHPSIDDHIEKIWIQRKHENPYLYDASKFRLADIKTECDASGKVTNVHFFLGNTNYRDFIGTNCSSHTVKIVESCNPGAESINIQDYMADPLGVGSLLETLDHKFVFMRRSDICAEGQGMVDRPGGHPEPQNVDVKEESDDVISAMVVNEIFLSTQNEIRDELNVPLEKLDESFLLGVVYNKETYNRPSLEFYTRCLMNSTEVHAEYMKQTQSEKDESVELIFIPSSELLSLCGMQNGPLWVQLTPSAQGAIKMFSLCHAYHHL